MATQDSLNGLFRGMKDKTVTYEGGIDGGRSVNKNLTAARKQKNDEFYTRLSDIEQELHHYTNYLRGKVVFCNCDDPCVSNFFRYFSDNFEYLGLKKLIVACYRNQERDLFSRHEPERAIWLEYTGNTKGGRVPNVEEIGIHKFEGDGDFRSAESIDLLKQSDIVVTNPPFSLFREYVAQLVEHSKKFLIIGNKNAIIYKEVFPLIKDNRLWVGCTSMSKDLLFDLPPSVALELKAKKRAGSSFRIIEGVVKGRSQSIWFTNIDIKKRHESLVLYKRYSPDEYPTYDNYDAIEVSKTENIPIDWAGVMGVPISFLDKYNPAQFELLGSNSDLSQDPAKVYGRFSYLNGKATFRRLFIRNKNPVKNQ